MKYKKMYLPGEMDDARIPETVRLIVKALNNALREDALTLSALFHAQVPLSDGAVDPFSQMLTMTENDRLVLGPLGVINGILDGLGVHNFRIYRDVQVTHPVELINFFGCTELDTDE